LKIGILDETLAKMFVHGIDFQNRIMKKNLIPAVKLWDFQVPIGMKLLMKFIKIFLNQAQ